MIDILLVAYVVYRLLLLLRGTRAWRAVIGIGVFALALFISDRLGLTTLHWILEQATILAPVVLVLIFLPELRQAIEGFAKVGELPSRLIGTEYQTNHKVLEEVAKACIAMAKSNTGALIVLERNNQLDDIAGNGVPVKAVVSAQLLEAIFYEGNPLHDGAVIIRNDLVLAAACRLPMSESRFLGEQYHMRHRAGLGMGEQSDSIVLIVSEERGQVSLVVEGKMEHLTQKDSVLERLEELMLLQPEDEAEKVSKAVKASKKRGKKGESA